jgi:hypothetical protein
MDAILISNLDGSNSQTFSDIAGYSKRDWTTHDAYFFLRRELNIHNMDDYHKAYRSGKIRHCKPYRGHWLDYTAKKEFHTLEEWAADAGDTIENVLYGVNRIHKRNFEESYKAKHFVGQTPKYVTLAHVLRYYGYVEPPKPEIPVVNVFDSFDDIAKELEINDVPVRGRSCLVKNPNGTIVIARIVDQQFYELEDTESKIFLSVPTDTPYQAHLYDRLSAMPTGSTIYFRSAEDKCFYSIDDLMK